jgi:aspartyl aminopeptidase
MDPSDFAGFLTTCATPYNFCAYARQFFTSCDYIEISEHSVPPELPSKFFVIRDGKTLLAFHVDGPGSAFIVGTHCDSPCLKLKPHPVDGRTLQCANYAGGLAHSMHGRDLRLAGGVLISAPPGVELRVVDDPRPIGQIPFPSCVSADSELSHRFTRTQMNPVFTLGKSPLSSRVASLLGVDPSAVVGEELSLVDARPATVFGDFILSPRLDNLGSTYAALRAFAAAAPGGGVAVCAAFDAEEIGSRTRTGAASEFLRAWLRRVCASVGAEWELFKARSLFVSADAGFANHPNFPGRTEVNHPLRFGDGVGCKDAPRGGVSRDAVALALIREAAKRAGATYVLEAAKNKRGEGGTIGPKVEAGIGIRAIDLGTPMQAMHSYREIMAWKDIGSEIVLLKYLYEHFVELAEEFPLYERL